MFRGVCVRVGDDVFLAATWNLFVISTRYRMPLLGAFSCRPSMSPEPSSARMPFVILWLSPTGFCCRKRHNSLFVLESCMVSLAICAARWLVYDVLFLCLFAFLCDSYKVRSRVLVWYVHTRRTLYETKQVCGLVSCTTSSYWGACWSKVLVLIWNHRYVRKDCYFWFFNEIFHFFSRYLVVGSRYDFIFRLQ